MPRTEKQNKEIREGRKQQILTVALQLFAEKGYQNVAISEIARVANISKGLMYNYFHSKDELLRSAMLDQLIDMMKEIDKNHDGVVEKSELLAFVDHFFELIEENTEFWKLYLAVTTQPKVFDFVKTELNNLMTPFFQLVLNYFQNAGYKNPMLEVNMFSAMLDGAIFHYLLNPEMFLLHEVKERIKDMYK